MKLTEEQRDRIFRILSGPVEKIKSPEARKALEDLAAAELKKIEEVLAGA